MRTPDYVAARVRVMVMYFIVYIILRLKTCRMVDVTELQKRILRIVTKCKTKYLTKLVR